MQIEYVIGDATAPVGFGDKLIIHVCNDIGAWGAGFVMALSKRWKSPEWYYRTWFRMKENFCLGAVQFVQVDKTLFVANMIGQSGIYSANGIPPIRYDAIDLCLQQVSGYCAQKKMTVHAPRFGAGLAGGDWTKIEQLIIKNLINNGIAVTIYDLE